MVVGGEAHTIVITTEGEAYGFGTNKDGQIGVGNTFEEYDQERRRKNEEDKVKDEEERK